MVLTFSTLNFSIASCAANPLTIVFVPDVCVLEHTDFDGFLLHILTLHHRSASSQTLDNGAHVLTMSTDFIWAASWSVNAGIGMRPLTLELDLLLGDVLC